MGKFWDDIVPNELKKPLEKYVTKPVASVLDKLIPNELRWAAPYAAGIGTLMLPPGMSPFMRGVIASGYNTLGQFAADESATGELEDLNALSQALSFGLGSLGSNQLGSKETVQGVSGANKAAFTQPEAYGKQLGLAPIEGADYFPPMGTQGNIINAAIESGASPESVSFLEGLTNVGKQGITSASDFVQGTRSTLADIGKNPGDLFKREIPGRKGIFGLGKKQFPVLQDAAVALTPTVVQGTGDVAYETAIDLQEQFDRDQLREMEEAGLGMDQIQRASAAAIRAGLEDNNFSEEEIAVIFDRLGLTEWLDVEAQPEYEFANGGLIGLARGGMPQMEMDYRGGGFIPVGSRERADDVPARLSKNEFVLTADAVRAAGGGSVNKGAQRMYDLMNNLEARA